VGFGSQTGYNRWGDYSAMRIDPSDDCTFWYTQEYQATTQSAAWNTRIGSFKFTSCGSTGPDVAITQVSVPASVVIGTLNNATVTVKNVGRRPPDPSAYR